MAGNTQSFRQFIRYIFREHPLISTLASLCLLLTVVFAGDALLEAIYFALPANNDRPLELWMSPRFVGQSWDLPRSVIFEIMEIDGTGSKGYPRTLSDVLERTGLTLSELQTRVEVAEAEMKARRGH